MANSTLDIPIPGAEINFDPQTMQDAWSMHMVLQVHRGLFKFAPEGNVELDIAESFEESKDKKEMIVRLKDVSFGDGTKLKASHVVNTFKRLFLIESSISADLHGIIGAKEIKNAPNIAFGVSAIDHKTVRIQLAKPNVLLKVVMATPDCSILKLDSPGKSVDPTIGLGAYNVSEQTDGKIVLKIKSKPNSRAPQVLVYRTGVKVLEDIQVNAVPDHYDLDSKKVDTLIARGFRRTVSDATRERFLMLNKEKFTAQERKSISQAIDPKGLSTRIGNPNLIPAYGLIPFGLPGANLSKPLAAPLVKPAKIGNGYARKNSLRVTFPDTWKDGELLASGILEQLRAHGIDGHLQAASFADWMTCKKNGDYDILINARGIDYPDPYAVLSYFKGGVSQNYLKQEDTEIDDLLEKALGEFDTEKRIHIYDQIEEKILKLNVIVPLLFGASNSTLWPPAAKFVPAHPLGFHFLSLENVEMN